MMLHQKRPTPAPITLNKYSDKSTHPVSDHKLSSARAFSGAKWFRFILTVVYASLFAWEVLYLPENISVAGSKGGGNFSPPAPPSFSVDILSVASISRPELLVAQKNTFASHKSVRNFFNATELDDYDPTCYKDLTWEDVRKVSSFCRKRPYGLSYEMRFLRGQYGRVQWLQQKPNPVGWLCAIQRPYAGLRKAYMHYQKSRQEIPDYFIILDDDSYYNMEIFQRNHEKLNSSEPTVVAGCLVRQPIHQINFTFPFGGFGAVFSKGSLGYLFHPIICPEIGNGTTPMIANHVNSEGICSQLSRDVVGELQYFENGMSLLDLIYKYVNTEKYRDVNTWTTGFCMHSDWVMGYFVNFYNASIHTKDPYYKNVPHARIEAYRGSEIYARASGFYKNERNCRAGSEICHKPPDQWMERETKHWRSNNNTGQIK